MVDYVPPWDVLPRDALHAAHDVPLEQVRKSAVTLASLLDEKKEEQVLKEACLGLCQLFGEGIQNDRIQAILEANVVPKLVALLRPSKSRSVPTSVQLAALQVLGNVACGDDRQTQVVIDSHALPCLRALLSSTDRQIRKEVCWIVSNITESSHQVQDVLDADILPPLLKLLDNQDGACREDASWVLFNLSSNRDPKQIAYLAEKNGVRALCNLLTCQKELDVLWKGCGTVAAVALKGLRNILISGQIASASESSPYNTMSSLVAEAHGVERIEALTTHASPDVRNRARLILERMFGAEPTTNDLSLALPPPSFSAIHPLASPPAPPMAAHGGCSCDFQTQHHHHPHGTPHYHTHGLYGMTGGLIGSNGTLAAASHIQHGIIEHALPQVHAEADINDAPPSTSGSSTDSDAEDDDSDSDLIPPPPAPCNCVLCSDASPLAERRPRGKNSAEDHLPSRKNGSSDDPSLRSICSFCSGGGRLGDGRAGLAAKLGRAVRLGHPHCLAILLSKMTWSQRVAATEAPALLHPGGGPPDGGLGSGLPAVILAAQLGKPACLNLLLKRCQPDLDIAHGKKRLTALAWAAHKGYLRCCQLLIDHGASPATKCDDGVTALHLAASGGGHLAICKLLIDNRAPINSLSSKKQTPLCLAAQKGFSKVVQLLLDHGADSNNEDEGKYTPLHLAASNGHAQTVEILLSHGAHVDATTRNEVTPLHYAVQGEHSAVVKALIAAGAKVNCNKKPLLLIAADDGNKDIVNLLIDAQATIDCRANIRAALDKEMEVSDYLTPLHLAASKNHHEVVELLLRRGANVNELTVKSGWSALDFAVLNGHSESAIILLQHGAIVTDTCKTLGRNNWTLVQYAANNGAKDVVRLLIQRLKEHRTHSSSSGSTEPNSTFPKPSAPLVTSNGPIVPSHGSNGFVTNPYVVSENLHTCTACSKLRQSACAPVETQSVYPGIQAMGRHQTRYDPHALETNENFSTAPVYSVMPQLESEVKHPARRRVVKEDRQSTLRAREIRKREAEALDARDRLEEAITQRSVSKLTEAISHVNKLVLHLATSVGSDSTSAHPDHADPSDYTTHSEAYGHGGHVHPPGQKHTATPANTSLVPAPLAMEVGLTNEVTKARKILAGLLSEEKRAREEKEREAMDSKRENAQQTVRKAITSALEGGDPRSLSRAINRATRSILDKDNATVIKGVNTSELISKLEKREHAVRNAVSKGDLGSLEDALSDTKALVKQLNENGGEGATARIFEGKEPSKSIMEAQNALDRLREKEERKQAEELKAKYMESKADDELNSAMKSDDIVRFELALNQAQKALISKQSALGATIEAAKKVMTKRLKTERRKLRQVSNTNDPEKIKEAVAIAEKFGLTALQAEIEAAKALAQKLREQRAAVQDLKNAISNSDVAAFTELRSKLNSLGMFNEAEKARSELERLQRATRARALLDSAVQECKALYEPIKELLAESKPSEQIMEQLSSWTWPDVQRLCDLSDRARQYGPSLSSLCETADQLSKLFAALGRQILKVYMESSDARAIAAVIAGYEKSFVKMSKSKEFDPPAGDKAMKAARKHLADVQALDQASVKAESAQVKVEYALATSRRSAARNRHGKGVAPARSPNQTFGSTASNPVANGNLALSDAQLRSPSSGSSDYVEEDSSEIETTSGSMISTEPSFVSRSSDLSRIGAPRRLRTGHQQSDDSGMREPYDNSPLLSGECSHFYLFKEGTTVCCARCGNHRNSSNPEWLARVKRRGSNVPPDLIAEFSGVPENINTLSFQGVAPQLGVQRGSPSRMAGMIASNERNTRSKVSMQSSNHMSSHQSLHTPSHLSSHPTSQGFSLGDMREPNRSTTLRPNTAGANVNIMMQLLQQQATAQPVKPSNVHHGRGRPQQHLPVTGPISHMPGMYPGDLVGSSSILTSGLSVPSSLGVGVPYIQPGMGSLAPIGVMQPGGVHGYALGGTMALDAQAPLRTSAELSMRSGVSQQELHMDGIGVSHVGIHHNGALNSRMDANRGVGEDLGDLGDLGMDLGLEFANENFGFDIDAIVDEPTLPQSKSAPDASSELHSDVSKMFAANTQNRHGVYFRR